MFHKFALNINISVHIDRMNVSNYNVSNNLIIIFIIGTYYICEDAKLYSVCYA